MHNMEKGLNNQIDTNNNNNKKQPKNPTKEPDLHKHKIPILEYSHVSKLDQTP